MRATTVLRARDVMAQGFALATPDEPSRDVLRRVLAAHGSHAVIVDAAGTPEAIAPLCTLLAAPPATPIGRLTSPTLVWVEEHESVAVVVQTMAMSGADLLLVRGEDGGVVGSIGTRNLIGLGAMGDSISLGG